MPYESVHREIAPPPRRNESAASVIGATIQVKGELSGDEDLLIEGRLEGRVSFPGHSVTVGRKGRVEADIEGKSIKIDGEVKGDLVGGDEVVIRQTGRVEGNLTAPRVTLENGASFRGSIDMEAKPAAPALKAKPAEARSEGRAAVNTTPPAAAPVAKGAGAKG